MTVTTTTSLWWRDPEVIYDDLCYLQWPMLSTLTRTRRGQKRIDVDVYTEMNNTHPVYPYFCPSQQCCDPNTHSSCPSPDTSRQSLQHSRRPSRQHIVRIRVKMLLLGKTGLADASATTAGSWHHHIQHRPTTTSFTSLPLVSRVNTYLVVNTTPPDGE